MRCTNALLFGPLLTVSVGPQAPIGGWPKDPKLKEIGEWVHLLLDHDTEGYVLFITMTLGWTREQILVYIAQLRREMKSGKKKAYYMQKVVWGRKPLDMPPGT